MRSCSENTVAVFNVQVVKENRKFVLQNKKCTKKGQTSSELF